MVIAAEHSKLGCCALFVVYFLMCYHCVDNFLNTKTLTLESKPILRTGACLIEPGVKRNF